MQRRKVINLHSSRSRLKARIYNLNSLLSYFPELYGIIESAASIIKQILWKYFQNLVDFEYDHGFKTATKIRKRHMEWFREKMKVDLA
nr:unnamed protein product [Callosobruchus analis]